MASSSSGGASPISFIARKWRIARRIYLNEGISALLAEILYYVSSPVMSAYDFLGWSWYRTRGQRSFTVFGHQITVLLTDPGISRELAVHRVHEPLATRLLQQTLEPGMNVVDIGSNIGYYALLEARLVGPQGKVFAIEPMQENARQLVRNIQANGYRNILVHELAIANRTGEAEMHVSQKSNWHSLSPVLGSTTKRRVPVSTLDDLLRRHSLGRVDLVRMDLEGHEVIVIKGMQWTLKKYGPRLLVELHPHLIGTLPIVEYLRSLQSLGYGVEWLIEQERDLPLRWRFLRVEQPTMNELMDDPRICADARAMTVLFARAPRASGLVHGEMSERRPGTPEDRLRPSVAIARSAFPRPARSSE